jgi:hypothetical protein
MKYWRNALGILWENLKERNRWHDLSVDKSLILKRIIKDMLERCRVLSYDLVSDQWQAAVKVVKKLQVPENVGNFLND